MGRHRLAERVGRVGREVVHDQHAVERQRQDGDAADFRIERTPFAACVGSTDR